MPPSANTASYLSHRGSFYNRCRQDSAGSNSSSGSVRGKRKAPAGRVSGTPSSLQRAAILAASQELARQEGSQSTFSESSSSGSSVTSLSTTNSMASGSKVKIESMRPSESARSILLENEYQEEAIKHMFAMEAQTMSSLELMDVQPELRWFMRPYLVDFLIEIHQTFGLRAETLFLTLNIVDRYVSKRIVYKRHYQLVGCAALLIAAKYEDSKDRVPTIQELSQMCCNAYDESAFTQMEGHVLATIGWNLGHPTAEAWLRIACVKSAESHSAQSIARFLMELSLFHRDFIAITPSALATGALILARYICLRDNNEFEKGVTEEAAGAARLLDAILSENLQDVSSILTKKYSSSAFGDASARVRSYYLRNTAASTAKASSPASRVTLLPAQMVGSSSSSRGEFEDDDNSERSRCTTPSSMASTPSRCGVDEDDDDDDMPLTPLSLHSLHDPLGAAQIAAGMQAHAVTNAVKGKESMLPASSSHDAMSTKASFLGNGGLTAPAAAATRPPLRSVSWDCNMQA
ncbi:hypothetical protein K437DRAFT_27200 [Tilletiaria anomala UBC 951]|uniref:Cyclin N-terminal domain-containing protein n=1 Tax=Tilletiaria anomala (strain ATCC 24038 / CBS 436.72 / UBC 951) TaxID=1037660 RepID=A0A066V9A4_TILAU|nr:uncharacterized protein K437DRAFT_27200 [Tilletiaria anomala UBC 951]KDN38317.1 hypothetical protein K437DRAFT_27200 [Tilletiaria anomala UBC 951]